MRRHIRLEHVAARAVEEMEDLIAAMERAAEEIAKGASPERVEDGGYALYFEPATQGREASIVCVWSAEECLALLNSVAAESGIHLEEMEELSVRMPEAEFGAGMVTGGFQAWKGISVEVRNDPLEELLARVFQRLCRQGLAVSSTSEDVILCLPLDRERART